jgi:pimeloyl-ACP methyl ester carboxylesterase
VAGTAVEARRTAGGIGYRAVGSGPSVLLLHGLGSSSWSWRHQLADLAPDHHMIAWDAPGYGESIDPDEGWSIDDYAAALADFIAELRLCDVHLIGHSMGGVIALAFCREHQDVLGSLMLVDSYCGGASRPTPDTARVQRRIEDFRTHSREQFARLRVPNLLGPQASPALFEEAVRIMSAVRDPAYEVANLALLGADVSDVLAEVRVPTSVVCGEHDSVTPVAESRRLADGIPGAVLTVVPGAGHLVNQEQPRPFNTLLRSHLELVARQAQAAKSNRG